MSGKQTFKVISDALPVRQKYTQQSYGFWERIRGLFAVDRRRSNGIPVKHFRNPAPGGLDPKAYDDPVTIPAGDIADNPYWRRDMRRSYPKLSFVTQGDVVGLLTVGNAAAPSPKLLKGEEGTKQLVALKDEGEKGLAAYFEKEKGTAVLGEGGMPPMPVAYRNPDATKYTLPETQAYSEAYPCRVFI